MHRRRLYRSPSEVNNCITNECRKRTFWAAYTLDRYLGVLLGRPRIFQDEDIDQEYPTRVNDEDLAAYDVLLCSPSDDCLEDASIYLAKYGLLFLFSSSYPSRLKVYFETDAQRATMLILAL